MSFLKTCLAEFVDPFDDIQEEKNKTFHIMEEKSRIDTIGKSTSQRPLHGDLNSGDDSPVADQ